MLGCGGGGSLRRWEAGYGVLELVNHADVRRHRHRLCLRRHRVVDGSRPVTRKSRSTSALIQKSKVLHKKIDIEIASCFLFIC